MRAAGWSLPMVHKTSADNLTALNLFDGRTVRLDSSEKYIISYLGSHKCSQFAALQLWRLQQRVPRGSAIGRRKRGSHRNQEDMERQRGKQREHSGDFYPENAEPDESQEHGQAALLLQH